MRGNVTAVLNAVIWGLVQGPTEFLPISSSGHLIIVPAFLSRAGMSVAEPELAVSAVLHLGTLLAVLAYYRRDIAALARFKAPRVLRLMIIGTIPALIGYPLRGSLDSFDNEPKRVALALLFTALVLFAGSLLGRGVRRLEQAGDSDAVLVGLAQALALIPGVSRSGMTITAGYARGLSPVEAARYSFLLAVPAIAAGGLVSLFDISEGSIDPGALVVGLIVSAVSGYAAISLLLRVLAKVGFLPFAIYAALVGLAALVLL